MTQLSQKVKPVKEVKSYGSLHLTSKDLPNVKNLSIGDKLTITTDIEVVGLRKPDRWEIQNDNLRPTDIKVNVEIRKVNIPDKKVSE